MNDSGIKEKLSRLGFTKKELAFMTSWSEKENLPLFDIIKDLRLRFLGGLFSRVLIFIFCIITIIKGNFEWDAVIFVLVVSFLIVEFFAPFKLGAKILLNFKVIKS